MKRLLLTTGATLLLALAVNAQTNGLPVLDTNTPPTIGSAFKDLGEFVSYAGTNIIPIFFGTIAQNNDGKYGAGGGVALLYSVNKYFLPGIRFDYLNKAFYEGSFNVTLQVPIQLSTGISIYPFAEGGVAIPFGGGTPDNAGTVQGIAGTGMAFKFGSGGFLGSLRAIVAIEKWSALPGEQIRFGLGYHKSI